jgi:DNA-binding FadR family transcriptional regulator
MLRTPISGRPIPNSHGLVVDGIGRAIVDGTYESGRILPGDAELAARFSVSRTVLREAMKTLAAKGLIVARARIGTRVTDRSAWNYFDADILRWHLDRGVDLTFLNQLSEMRRSFEPFAARLACSRATPEDIARMHAHATAMAEATSMEGFARADLEFHRTMLAATRNPFMLSVGTLIEAALATSFRLSSPFGEGAQQQRTAAAHRRIAERIGANDPDGAAAAVETVINEAVDRISRTFAHAAD